MVTDWKQIVLKTKAFADSYIFENLNMYGPVAKNIYQWIEKHHPDFLKKYQSIFDKNSTYWYDVENEINNFCQDKEIDGSTFFHHS
jgi:hypothetical protein